MSAPASAPLAVSEPVGLATFARASVLVLRTPGRAMSRSEANTLADLLAAMIRRGPMCLGPDLSEAMAKLLAGLADGLDGGAA